MIQIVQCSRFYYGVYSIKLSTFRYFSILFRYFPPSPPSSISTFTFLFKPILSYLLKLFFGGILRPFLTCYLFMRLFSRVYDLLLYNTQQTDHEQQRTLDTIFVLCQPCNVWLEYTILLFEFNFYAAVFYGVQGRISCATFLQLKIQLQMARFEPRTFQVPVQCAAN